MSECLSEPEIRHLVERDLDLVETKLLLHHLALCPDCYRVGGFILDLHRAGLLSAPFSSVDLDLARSRAEAPRLFAKLSRYSFARQKGLVRDARQFRSWGLAELLSEKSLEAASTDPPRALELADLSVTLASVIWEGEFFEPEWLYLLRSLAWAHLGNARRVVGEIRSAEDAFTVSESWWLSAQSAGDVLCYEAKVLALKASLRRTQGRFDEALDLLDRALLAEGSETLRPEILMSKAFTHGEAGDLRASIVTFREAIASLKSKNASPRLYYALHHNLLDALSKAGETGEAEALLPEVRALAEKAGEALDLSRLRWIEARIKLALGKREESIAILDEVRRGFIAQELFFDSALVSLELSHLYLSAEEHDAVQAIASDLLPVFEAEKVPREALATLSLFCRAAESKLATSDLALWTLQYLEEARRGGRL